MDLAKQLTFRPVLPVVLNNADYLQRESLLKRMDQLLTLSGLEESFIEASVLKWLGGRDDSKVSGEAMAKQVDRARRALRCNILINLLQLPYREMSIRLAECALYQWFCHIDRLSEVKVPSKSEIGRFIEMVDAETLKELNHVMISKAAEPASEEGTQVLNLKNEIELKTIWMDSTALKANIHFPVDWVLLRDGVRTLMLATILIRQHGLKHRMVPPEQFLGNINRLCMAMTACRRKSDSRKKRKQVFRQMKKLVKTVQSHALRHKELLEEHWSTTDWTEPQAAEVMQRIQGVLDLLPEAIKQAHARIIRGEQTKNKEKILSLYEPDVNVIVRGKADAEIEFGNSLLLSEQRNGVIVDWNLHQATAPNDSRQFPESIERIQAAHGKDTVKAVAADRQFDSKQSRGWMDEQEIYNAVCPRSPQELKNKKKSSKFQSLQRRRAQTESRIAIFKNVFLGNPIKRRGFKNRELQVGWAVLSHNLWLLARLEKRGEPAEQLPQAA